MSNTINNPSPASVDRQTNNSLLRRAALVGALSLGSIAAVVGAGYVAGPKAERAHPTAEEVNDNKVELAGTRVKTQAGEGISDLIVNEGIEGDIRPLEAMISEDLKAFEEANPDKMGVVILANERVGDEIVTKYVAVAESVPAFLESLESDES